MCIRIAVAYDSVEFSDGLLGFSGGCRRRTHRPSGRSCGAIFDPFSRCFSLVSVDLSLQLWFMKADELWITVERLLRRCTGIRASTHAIRRGLRLWGSNRLLVGTGELNGRFAAMEASVAVATGASPTPSTDTGWLYTLRTHPRALVKRFQNAGAGALRERSGLRRLCISWDGRVTLLPASEWWVPGLIEAAGRRHQATRSTRHHHHR